MTDRKPAGMSFESWIDRQIRDADSRGEFDDLPGKGKPLAGHADVYDELWWVNQKLKREGVAALPLSLRLRREAQDDLAAAARARTEADVRRIVEALNEKILAAIRRPSEGPPVDLVPYDVDAVVQKWRLDRAEAAAAKAADTKATDAGSGAAPEPARRRSGLVARFGRGRR
ncbi:MAG TPA: DUF1992 domain-containing protein [Actinocrinis sp.]|jgi:hypothetical protein